MKAERGPPTVDVRDMAAFSLAQAVGLGHHAAVKPETETISRERDRLGERPFA